VGEGHFDNFRKRLFPTKIQTKNIVESKTETTSKTKPNQKQFAIGSPPPVIEKESSEYTLREKNTSL